MAVEQHSPLAQAEIAIARLAQAHGLFHAAHHLKYESIHLNGLPPGLSPDKVAQRKAILELAHQLSRAHAESVMDEAVGMWQVYRKMQR